MRSQQQLFARYLQDLPAGELSWIGLRPTRREPLIEVEEVMALAGLGLEGDHRCRKSPGSARQISLISNEHIGLIAHYLKLEKIHPGQLRRNLVVRNINLTALRHQRFRIGEALFEATALCHPCSRMSEALGPGAVAAMLGQGGLCARVLESGRIRLHDPVQLVLPEV
ncbi:MOSC domain-containing protein [Pseudomaricurvus alkylphenolicus]|uniref:MOSC domain-containing protein n=1 Tax=Pseudomaricurvus alkylphenolicus TaxID=1306991 RepID=UPI00141F2A72|nr:MOSC domain-containing protein [Pseudomaricurvus alkylphenolicus]NIB40164.1 MOSC domain-containing protein [Pseudomaricurvus alkylphenolicus]